MRGVKQRGDAGRRGYARRMFTGIVQRLGRVAGAEERPFGVRLTVESAPWEDALTAGESISVNGCCLTLTDARAAAHDGRIALSFDVVRETLNKTTLGALRGGGGVNLERACRADSLLGGHVVQGHVDGVGRIVRVRADPSDWRIEVEPPPGLMEYVTPKGSVAIDGVSLTVAAVSAGLGSFEIALVPTTLERTTLGGAREDDACNVETDIVARTVVHWARNYAPRR